MAKMRVRALCALILATFPHLGVNGVPATIAEAVLPETYKEVVLFKHVNRLYKDEKLIVICVQ